MKGEIMSNKKYIFYPYSHEAYGFIRGLQSLNIKFDVISPNGFGLIGKDISYAINGKELGKQVKGYLDIDFNEYDSIIISEDLNDSMRSEVIEIIQKSKESNLEIINYCKDKEYVRLFPDIQCKRTEKEKKERLIKRYMNKIEELNLPF